jgi:hypothetical protein
VVALLDHDEGDAGLVVWLELDAGLANCGQLVLQDLKGKENEILVFFVIQNLVLKLIFD